MFTTDIVIAISCWDASRERRSHRTFCIAPRILMVLGFSRFHEEKMAVGNGIIPVVAQSGHR